MPAIYKLRFLPPDPSHPDMEMCGSRGNYYEFGDGNHLDVWSTPVWCHECRDYKYGERIETLEEIDRHLEEARNPTSKRTRSLFAGRMNREFRMKWAEKLQRRREWLQVRRSPPRCLQCGSTDIVRLPENEAVPNPDGPGSVVLEVSGLCSTWFNNWYFTPEGERIPRDTQPSYWTLPRVDDE